MAIAASLLSGCGGGGGGGGSTDTKETAALTLKGQVLDATGAAVSGAQVQLDKVTASTNEQGRFELVYQTTTSQTPILRIAHPQFLLYAKDFVALAGESEPQFRLTPYGATRTFNSASGVQLELSNAQVGIPAKGLVSLDGTAYMGEVTIRGHYGNHDTQAGAASFPQPYLGTNGQSQALLISAGVITVEMRDATGQLLQLAPGVRATLTYPPSNTTGSATEIPMWYYDKVRAIWVREGTATRQTDGSYVGQVSHFTPWNIDYPVDRATLLKGCVVGADGKPATFIYSTLVGPGFRASGVTDAQGQFEAYVPNGINLKLSAEYETEVVLNVPPLSAGEKRQLPSCLKLKLINGLLTVVPPANVLLPLATTPLDPASFLSPVTTNGPTPAALCDTDDFARTLQNKGVALQTSIAREGDRSEDIEADTEVFRYDGTQSFQGVQREALIVTYYIGNQEQFSLTNFFSVNADELISYGINLAGSQTTGTAILNPPRINPRRLSLGATFSLPPYSITTTYTSLLANRTEQFLEDRITLQGFDTIRMGGQDFETCRFIETSTSLTAGQANFINRGRNWVVATGDLKGLVLIDENLDAAGTVTGRTRVTGYRWLQP
jgi:hypothetical protein